MRLLIQDGTIITFGRALAGSSRAGPPPRGRPHRADRPRGRDPGPVRPGSRRLGQARPSRLRERPHALLLDARARPREGRAERQLPGGPRNLWWRLDRKLSLDDVEMSAQVILLDAIRKGTTTLVDHHASPGAVRGSLDRIARAVKDSGLRSCLCYEVSDRDGAAITDEGLEENAAFARACCGGARPAAAGPLRAARGLHSLGRDARTRLADGARPRRRLPRPRRRGGVRRGVEPEQHRPKRPVERLVAHGILGEGSIAAHGVHCDDADMDAARASGTWSSTTPSPT